MKVTFVASTTIFSKVNAHCKRYDVRLSGRADTHCVLLFTLRQFPDDIFRCIFLIENVWFCIKISLKFVPNGSINNIRALVQTMAWHRPGDKPLSEPMMAQFTRPQLVKISCTSGSGNGLPPNPRQAITRHDTDSLLSIAPIGTNFTEM